MERRTRIAALTALLLVLTAVFGFQAVTADRESGVVVQANDTYAGDTLITVQSYGGFGQNNGNAFIVSPEGKVVWKYDPPNARVFDAEPLDNGNVLVSVAHPRDPADCPEAHLQANPNTCVENRVVEVDPRQDNEVVWEYDWYDEFINHHEVHDADRLDNGETAIADMGNNRAFTVDRSGDITWQWNATDHLTPGTPFYEQYGGPERGGPESDWTHLNDIDRLENGNYQLSIRNFDVVVEVDPETNEIVNVLGTPRETAGDDALLYEQHNPHPIERWDTVLVSDSENDRVVEARRDGEVVWKYGGSGILRWPRDADRLPNGNTLITDSLNYRVIEIDDTGEVVWEYSVVENGKKGIPYEANRIGLESEEPDRVTPGWQLAGRTSPGGDLVDTVRRYESWILLVLPQWVGRAELLTLLAGTLVSLVVVADFAVLGVRVGWRRYRERS